MLGSTLGLAGPLSVYCDWRRCSFAPNKRVASLKGRHGSGNKGNIESGQSKSKMCSCILKHRDRTPLFVTMDTSCKHYFKRDNVLYLCTSNSSVDHPLPCPPLNRRQDGAKSTACGGGVLRLYWASGPAVSDMLTCSVSTHTDLH